LTNFDQSLPRVDYLTNWFPYQRLRCGRWSCALCADLLWFIDGAGRYSEFGSLRSWRWWAWRLCSLLLRVFRRCCRTVVCVTWTCLMRRQRCRNNKLGSLLTGYVSSVACVASLQVHWCFRRGPLWFRDGYCRCVQISVNGGTLK